MSLDAHSAREGMRKKTKRGTREASCEVEFSSRSPEIDGFLKPFLASASGMQPIVPNKMEEPSSVAAAQSTCVCKLSATTSYANSAPCAGCPCTRRGSNPTVAPFFCLRATFAAFRCAMEVCCDAASQITFASHLHS